MSKYRNFQDIFDLAKREEVQKRQSEYIDYFKEISSKMIVLQGQDEANALPEIITLIGFMQHLLALDDIMEVFNQLPDLSNYLMDHVFKDLCQLILRVGLFPTAEVLECTAKFLELHLQVCLRVVQRGYTSFLKVPEQILANGKKQYYSSNNSKCDPIYFPFGDKLGDHTEFYKWAGKLKVGDQLDAVKFCKKDTVAIWSRAIVVEVNSNHKLSVKFYADSSKIYHDYGVFVSPFRIQAPKSRSLDYEWRENIKVGEEVDVFVDKQGWMLLPVLEITKITNPDTKEQFQIANFKYELHSKDDEGSSEDDWMEIALCVHDPLLRKGGTFSPKRFIVPEYQNDEIYEAGNDDMYAMYRGNSESMTARRDTYLTSRFFLRFVNIFCIEGGLQVMKEKLSKANELCPADFIGSFMTIIEAISPYLLNRTVQQYGDEIIRTVMHYMLESPIEIVKTFSAEMIQNVYSGVRHLAKRVYSRPIAVDLYERFLLKMAVVCVKTDFLERKLNGVSFLGEIHKLVKAKEFVKVGKKDLLDVIEQENIVEQILKGHPQLIAKSQELLKLIFDEKAMSEKNMQLMWNTMRKGDLETRNSILTILNSIYYELSYRNMEFLINQIRDVDPKLLMPDEIELAYKMVNFSKYKSDYPTDEIEKSEPLSDKVVRMFWKICTSPDINNPDLISKSISKLMGLLKFSSNQKLENDIVKDSIENLKKGQAVIQSIEVIREMLASLDTPSESLMNTLIQNDAIRLTIASLKKVKADIKAAAAKNNSQVTEANVNQLLGDKNYNFETHVQKRLNFVYSLFAQMKDKKEIFNAIDAIWDELVENTILDAEVGYFKNWFTPLGTNQVNLELTKEILREFFSNKVKLLLKENRAGGNKNEILSIFTECFLRMNILAKNINPVVVRIEEEQSYTNETKHLLTKSPSKLEGIDDLWKTALEVPDKDMCMNLINFITNLYIRPELDVMDPDDGYSSYLKEFLDFCVEKYNSYDLTTSEGKTASWRILHMMKDVIDKTESRYVTPSLSLSSFYKGKTATITVDNKISNYFSTAKLIDVKVAGNTTIQHIKNAVAKELKRTTWRQVKLLKGYRKTEIPDRYNSRNLRELGISLNDKFVSEYRATPVIKAEPLVLNSDSLSQDPVINPKAIKAFKTIFNIFQVDGKMRPEQLVKMCEAVLDERNLTTEFSQVKETMSKYDKENKGYLSEDDLVAFYRDAAIYKSMAVMQNLKMLNFNDQLVLNDPSKVFEPKPEFLARDYLLESKSDFVLKLREATEHVPELQEEAWQVLSRLPPIPHVIKQILNLEGVKGVEKPNWEKIIDCRCPYKALYNLFILDFLLDDSKAEEGEHPLLQGLITVPVDQFKREWKIDFIKSGGYQHLFEVLKSFVEKGVKTEHEVLLFSFIMKAVKTYLLASVTIKNPSIYSNIAFIPTTKVPFTALSGKTTSDKKDEKTHSKTEEDQLKIQLEPKVETGAQPIGPLNEAEAKKTTTTGTTTNATTETAKKEEEKQLETLVEKAEFIAFREALISMGEGGDARVDKIETLRFLVRLCENILQKSEQQHFEELTIVELSLSIIFCFILSDQKLLTDLIVTDNIKLLEENSPSKAAGYSDFVSFFLAGLLAKRGYLYVKMFDNAFKILLREAGSKDIQTILVKVVFENSVKSDLALRDSARHIELAVLLLGSICSEGKDDKILLDKSDINSITDLRNLFFDIFGKIFKVKAASREELYFESELLSGYFKLLEKLLAIEPKLKTEIAVSNPQIVERLFSECLFNSPTGQTETKELICKNYFTRTAGFELLSELCRAEPENLQTLLKCGLKSLSMNLPKVSSWSYTVSQGKRSELGFVGLYNLSCICYMNAMLQQFYMTPTFRYGLLMADDGEAENIVPVEDKKIDVDDNLFHQLQKMFAFLDKSERRDYNPFEFCFSYKDHSGQPVNVMIQQDTKEFLDVFFDKIERSLKPTPFRNILYDVYGGKTINLIECSSCSNLRTSEDIFYNLSLEVKNLKNIGEGIEKFITEDTISDYKCEKCLQKCDVYKRTLIKECPNVLIVHLQRIIFDLDVLMNVKINSWYEFPQKLNLEEYTYSHYMKHHKNRNEKRVDPEDAEEMSTENLGIRGEHSYPMDSQLAPESGPVPSEPSNPEPQPASQPPKPVAPEENFEYNLAGVIVHLGSADVGHYYSYINVNRNDPGRVKISEDKWVEFNDSSIRTFKVSDLEEECFGSKEEPKNSFFEEDYMGFFPGRGGKFNIDKCAYILVYEKTEKRPITFHFTKDNLSEKEKIMKTIKEDKVDQAVFKEVSDGQYELTVGFYDLNPYLPPKLSTAVNNDNFKFLIEQHVYSKDFLTFMCKLTDYQELKDFVPQKLPKRLYTEPLDPKVKEAMFKCLECTLQFALDVFAKIEEPEGMNHITANICRMISVCHDKAFYLLKEKIAAFLPSILSALLESPELGIRSALSEIICHLIIVSINSEDIEITENETKGQTEYSEDMDEEDTIKYIIRKLLTVFKNDKKDLSYKKLKGFFRIWLSFCKSSTGLCVWLIKKQKLLERILYYYMDKHPSPYEVKNELTVHEHTMDPILSTLVYIANFVKDNGEDEDIPLETISSLSNLEFFSKVLGENYSYNSFKNLKAFIRLFCVDDIKLSKKLALACLKELSGYSNNPIGQLEVLTELALIDDQFSALRREAIFGYPTVLDLKDFSKKNRFGFQVHKDLSQPAIRYKSPLNFGPSGTSFLKLVVEALDKTESDCFIYLTYLLRMMIESTEIFEFIIHLPSPVHLYANFHDWFIPFVLNYKLDRKIPVDSIYDTVKSTVLFEGDMKERLTKFQELYLDWLKANHPEATADKYTLLVNSVEQIYCTQPYRTPIEDKPIFPLSKTLIVGSVKADELESEVTLYESGTDVLTLKISQMPVLATQSLPTGATNLSLSRNFRKSKFAYTGSIPTDSKLYKFFDCDEDKKSESSHSEHITTVHSTDSAHISTGKSAAEASKGESTMAEISEAEGEYDLKYYRTNYMLKLSVTNTTNSVIAFAFKITPKENCNVYFPANDFSVNVRNKKNFAVAYYMKKDPELPFGDFTVSVIFSELGENESPYTSNNLEIDDDTDTSSYDFTMDVCITDQLLKPKLRTKHHKKSEEKDN